MNKTEKFIEKVKKVHGDIYNYNKVEYINAKSKILIFCNKHTEYFTQTPDKHLQGNGCPKCGREKTISSRKISQKDFIKRSTKKHNNFFDYSETIYTGSSNKVKITCPKHGEFFQLPVDHLQGKGCKKCAITEVAIKNTSNTEKFIEKAKEVHKDTYDYSKVDYKNAKTSITITCKIHGDFEQKPYHHTQGSGCKECGNTKSEKAKFLDKNKVKKEIEEFLKGKGELKTDKFIKIKDSIIVECIKHGEFKTTPSKLLGGIWCKKCSTDKIRLTEEEFISKAKVIHKDKYNYNLVNYENSKVKVKIECPEHGIFEQVPNGHLNGNGCIKCSNYVSKPEIEITEVLKNLDQEVEQTVRNIKNVTELDIYLPKLKTAIEYNGLYWHSEIHKDKNYHLDKLENCNKQDIRLIQIFEDEWLNKRSIVESRLRGIVGSNKVIYARKTEIKEVSPTESSRFLEENHLQGRVGAKVKLGLYVEDILVAIMTFGNLRAALGSTSKEGEYELLRFCNKLNTTVVGGASKLLKHFIKEYKPKNIISYADRRWSEGNVYEKIGFNKISISKPNYFYTKGIVRENRFKYRKSELIKAGFSKEKTEKQIMSEQGYYRIYDCGTIKYEMIIK